VLDVPESGGELDVQLSSKPGKIAVTATDSAGRVE
jgi:hypothetical protein